MSNNKQYHFVVKFDAETQRFEMDYDTQEEKFHNAPVFDPETNSWVELTSDDIHWDGSLYSRSGDALAFALEGLLPDIEELSIRALNSALKTAKEGK